MKHKTFIYILILLVLANKAAYAASLCPPDERVIEIKDYELGVHLLVENCENIGTFSVGGLYDSEFKKLTFSYPIPWKGTFITLNVNDRIYSNSINPEEINQEEKNFLDDYVTRLPYKKDNKIIMQWLLPEDIRVEQILEVVDRGIKISLNASNHGSNQLSFGARIHLDTMLGENDGAPIYIPGDGLKSYEKEYIGKNFNFRYWKAYNKAEYPSVIATGILKGDDLTYPDKLVVANWKRSMKKAWDYSIDTGSSILGDSALIIYYNPRVIQAGEYLTFSTSYLNGEPILPPSKGDFGIADILTDRLNKGFCSGEEVKIKVDVLSRKTANEGIVSLTIVDEEGMTVYEIDIQSGVVQADSINTLNYTYTLPLYEKKHKLRLTATLNREGTQLDNKTIELLVDPQLCGAPPKKVEINWVIPLVLIILLFIVAAAAYIIYGYYLNKGEIKVIKTVENEKINVFVENDTRKPLKDCVIEDYIPPGAEVNIITAGVHRIGDKLTWEIGVIPPREHIILEYRMKKQGILQDALFRWDSGEKKSE